MDVLLSHLQIIVDVEPIQYSVPTKTARFAQTFENSHNVWTIKTLANSQPQGQLPQNGINSPKTGSTTQNGVNYLFDGPSVSFFDVASHCPTRAHLDFKIFRWLNLSSAKLDDFFHNFSLF